MGSYVKREFDLDVYHFSIRRHIRLAEYPMTEFEAAMEVTPRPTGLPNSIFGLKHSKLSVNQSQRVLKHYRKHFSSRDRKPSLLNKLAALEKEITESEINAIKTLIEADSSGPIPMLSLQSQAIKTEDNNKNEPYVKQENDAVFKECSVCTASFGSSHFPHRKLTPDCDHEPSTCIRCLTESIESQIPNIVGEQVKCPECPESLPFDVVKEWTSQELFEKYDQNLPVQYMSSSPSYVECLGPNCGTKQFQSGDEVEHWMACNFCQFKTCLQHQMPWHEGQSCDEYDAAQQLQKERLEQEQASMKLISDTAKICPNPSCGHGITKIDGCDHMTCRRCNFEFCYVCRVSYTRIRIKANSAHHATCKHNSNRLPVFPVGLQLLVDQDTDEEDLYGGLFF